MSNPALQAVPTPAPDPSQKSKFSLARAGELAKFWVGLAGALVATAIQVTPHAPHWLITADVYLTAAGVFIVKHPKARTTPGEASNDRQMTVMNAATDGVGDPAHPASVDLPDVPAAPEAADPATTAAAADPALPPLDLSQVEPPQS